MVEQIGQFIINHWQLWLALSLVLVAILINELIAKQKAATSLSTAAAVNLINNEEAVVIDLRDKEQFRKGHIIDAHQFHPDELKEERLAKFKAKPLLFVCQRGLQSATVAASLKAKGFKTYILAGGFDAWLNANLPLIKGK